MKRTRRGENREINRDLRAIAGRANEHNANSRSAERRRKQMLKGQLGASNGVVTMSESEADRLIDAYEHAQAAHAEIEEAVGDR